MTFDECMSFIGSYSRLGEKVTDLSRARELAELIGNPEKKLKFVHVAGTNGKGSTLEYIANALQLSGYKTGKFTSPFVLRYTDRIRINDREIDEQALGEICSFVAERVADRKYSQFEITMAIALLWFEREKCDIVVLETGIGGLLDCTNIIPPPLLAVITSVSLDHTQILGNTVEEIAAQKAGIIKEGSAVVLSADNPESVGDIVFKTAKNKGAHFIMLEETVPHVDGGLYAAFVYKKEVYKPAMPGIHQYYNALTALTACCFLREEGFDIPDKNIKKSIETTQIKARAQYIDGQPPVIVDGGHNPAGVNMLSLLLMYLSTRNKKIYAVTGMTQSKDYAECLKTLVQYCDRMFTVDCFADNAVSADILAKTAEEYAPAEACASLDEAVENARTLALENDGIVVICGSLYLASDYLNSYEDNSNSIQK